jgi:hypothetical protein
VRSKRRLFVSLTGLRRVQPTAPQSSTQQQLTATG